VEIAGLFAEIESLSRERDEHEERARRLTALQDAFTAIVAETVEDRIAGHALRGAFVALGFTRALWFQLDEAGDANAAFACDGDASVEPSEYGDTFPDASVLHRLARGERDAAAGYADDVDVPLYDVRGWYAMAVLRERVGRPVAILYADGAPERSIAAWSIASLGNLAAHAALALEAIRLARAMERLAMNDPLTGLINRRALLARVGAEIANAERGSSSFAYVLVDVDNFKRVNDTLGHAAGDAHLKRIADAMREATRAGDVPARFAGDEFAMILIDADAHEATQVLERLYDVFRSQSISCSSGVAMFPSDGLDEAALFSAADAALYRAKDQGKDRFAFSAASIGSSGYEM